MCSLASPNLLTVIITAGTALALGCPHSSEQLLLSPQLTLLSQLLIFLLGGHGLTGQGSLSVVAPAGETMLHSPRLIPSLRRSFFFLDSGDHRDCVIDHLSLPCMWLCLCTRMRLWMAEKHQGRQGWAVLRTPVWASSDSLGRIRRTLSYRQQREVLPRRGGCETSLAIPGNPQRVR